MYRNYEAIETLLAAGADIHKLDWRGLTPSQEAPDDECVIYLFSGGKIKDKAKICQPPQRVSSSWSGVAGVPYSADYRFYAPK